MENITITNDHWIGVVNNFYDKKKVLTTTYNNIKSFSIVRHFLVYDSGDVLLISSPIGVAYPYVDIAARAMFRNR
jgi:hypothetical protein